MAMELSGPKTEIWRKASCSLRGHMAIPTLFTPVELVLPTYEGEWGQRPMQHSWGAMHSKPLTNVDLSGSWGVFSEC